MNLLLSRLADYLWIQSWQLAILVALAGIASFLLRDRSAHIRYLAWLIVLAKCLLPPVMSIPIPLLPAEQVSLGAPGDSVAARAAVAASGQPAGPQDKAGAEWGTSGAQAATVSQARPTPDIHVPLGLLWLSGVIVFLSAVGAKTVRTILWLRRGRRPPTTALEAALRELFALLAVRRPPRVWRIDNIGQPFVWGLIRGDIYVPVTFDAAASPEHHRHVLAHEVSHVPGSGPIRQTNAYEALTLDSYYVVRGDAIVQESEDRARYSIRGIAPGEYTVTAIEHPWFEGIPIERQQSKPLTLRAGEKAGLDFDLGSPDAPQADMNR